MRRRRSAAVLVAASLLVALMVAMSAALAAAGPAAWPDGTASGGAVGVTIEGFSAQAQEEMTQILQQKLSLTQAQKKIDTSILSVVWQAQARMTGPSAAQAAQTAHLSDLSTSLARIDDAGRVAVKLSVPGISAGQRQELEALGLEASVSLPEYGILEGTVPWDRVEAVAALDFVRSVRAPGYAVPNAGEVTSAGDAVLRAAEARSAFAVDGSGVEVGVISDGVSHLSASQASGDLPSVDVLEVGDGDEGTAMLEIVHDLAPGSALAFYSPYTSSDMAAGIGALGSAGCDVVVDDLTFFDEPKFEDGPIALAARAFVLDGGVYATSAGNSADRHYRHTYVPNGETFPGPYRAWHDYAEGPSVDLGNTFTVPVGGTLIAVLQWNNEWGSAGDDFDLWLQGDSGALAAGWDTQDGDDAPIEGLEWTNNTTSSVSVYLAVGESSLVSEPSSLVLDYSVYCHFSLSGIQYDTPDNSVIGHAAVEEVLCTAAARASTPDTIEYFSSWGPGTIFYPSLQDRQVPNITAVDGVQTKTGQLGYFLDPFYGTSAAAPHVAAIAALVWDADPTLTSKEVFDVLTSTAVDLETPGWDVTSGYGRVDAYKAVGSVLGLPTVDSLAPAGGPAGGGTSVVITGTNFVGVSNPSYVTFGGTDATDYTVDSDTQITATAPAHDVGTVQVQVIADGGTTENTAADDYTYVDAPSITELAPSVGPMAGGQDVTITGTDFIDVTGVTFGGTNAMSYHVDSPTQITAKSSDHAPGTRDVQVTAIGGSSDTSGTADDYTYVGLPTITGIAPSGGSCAGGTSVVITGTNFVGVSDASYVTFGGTDATDYTVDSDTQITATAPAHDAGTVQVQVTAIGGSSDTSGIDDDYTYIGAPTITRVAPSTGPCTGGTVVAITGTGFIGIAGPALAPDAVTFGGVNASTYTVDSDTQITATAPAHDAGTVRVQISAVGGTSVDGATDDYLYYIHYSSIRGDHRYHTAQLISQAMFPEALPPGAGLVLAPGETFQEALCGAPLAAAWGGPVLLTYRTALDNGTKAELQRLAPSRVFCVGMSVAVVNAVAAALPGATVDAINGVGDNVYDMSYRVAKALQQKVGDLTGATAIITIGTNFPDALGVSPLACAKLWPILLTEPITKLVPEPKLNPKAGQALSELGITQVIKVGTYVTTPANIKYYNLSGADRYFTNANVAKWAQTYAGLTFTHTGIATGGKFPDALAAGPFLGKDGGVLLLSPLNGPLPPPISALIAANRAEVREFSFIAMIEPVIGVVKALLL